MSDLQEKYQKALADYQAEADYQDALALAEQRRQIQEISNRPLHTFRISAQERLWRSLGGGLFS